MDFYFPSNQAMSTKFQGLPSDEEKVTKSKFKLKLRAIMASRDTFFEVEEGYKAESYSLLPSADLTSFLQYVEKVTRFRLPNP